MAEIILTDNPDVVIQRTNIDTEISINGLQTKIANFQSLISELETKISELNGIEATGFLQTVIDKEISELEQEKYLYGLNIESINNLLIEIS